MPLLAIFLHGTLTWLGGWALLRCRPRPRPAVETLLVAACVGLFAETMAIALLRTTGLSLQLATALWGGAAGVGIAASWLRRRPALPALHWVAPRWYEWGVAVFALEIVLFGVWQLWATPLYFTDAMTHWSGRARSLFGGVNWSLDPQSAVFLGQYIGDAHYPQQIVVWRAAHAVFAGQWTDLAGRFDGVVWFAVAVLATHRAVWEFSRSRGLAAGAAFAVAVLPLHTWHLAAGYADLAVEALGAVAVLLLLRRDWFWSGVVAAGIAWSKNDGFVLFVPGLAAGAALLGWSTGGDTPRQRAVPLLRWLLGFATIAPWLAIKWWFDLGFAPNQEGIAWHDGALRLFLELVFLGPTHLVFWPFVTLILVACSGRLLRDPTGRALAAVLVTTFTGLVLVFCCTDAYRFLKSEETIHRSMLQLAAIAVIVASYGVHRARLPA